MRNNIMRPVLALASAIGKASKQDREAAAEKLVEMGVAAIMEDGTYDDAHRWLCLVAEGAIRAHFDLRDRARSDAASELTQ